MSIDPTTLTNLQALTKPQVCAYWKVSWDAADSSQDRYYSDASYNQFGNFNRIGVSIEVRLLGNIVNDTQFEINADLRTETIPLVFDDIDKAITAKFQTFKSGVRCELFYYYPDVDLTYSIWFGQLQAPQIYGHKTLQTVASNGFRSREQQLPKRMRPRECTSNFGGTLPSVFAVESNACAYDLHLGGSTGAFKDPMISQPYDGCPRLTTADCQARLPQPAGREYFTGFNTDASATLTDGHSGYVAVTKGNESALKVPIRVIAGQKYLRGLQLLLWRREANANTPAHGFVAGIWEIGEGPVVLVYNFKVIEKIIEQMHQSYRQGNRGEYPTPYASSVSNFSNTAIMFARYGWVNPLELSAAQLTASCNVTGFSRVAVFSDPSTYGRQWCDDRVWWLFEGFTNQTWGMANPSERFEIADWITTSQWTRDTVECTVTYPDGETQVHSGRRSIFDAALEGRPVAEQIEDICRSGAVSVPFQHEGKYTITPFRPATPDELTNARVFTDTGSTKNIIWAEGQPAITLEQTPDDRITNEIVLTFEEATNYDTERPITVDDPDQKLKAGRVLGNNNLQSVPKRYAAFGCRYLQEVVRLGNRLLRFGEFDEGGTQNNLRDTFTVPFEQALGVKRYEIIKVVSALHDGITIGTVLNGTSYVETPQYFRVLRLRKIQNGLVQITAQAYNQTAYEGFEIVTAVGTGSPATAPGSGGSPPHDPPIFPPCLLTFAGAPTYDATNGALSIPINPC